MNVLVAHLHHDAQVFDVVLLRLNQLVQNKPEQKNGAFLTTAEDTAVAAAGRAAALTELRLPEC